MGAFYTVLLVGDWCLGDVNRINYMARTKSLKVFHGRAIESGQSGQQYDNMKGKNV